MSLWLVYILTCAAITCDLLITFSENFNGKVKKAIPAASRALILCILAFIAYQFSIEESEWKARVVALQSIDSSLGAKNLKLGSQIDSLSSLNIIIGSKTQTIASKNVYLAQTNISLSTTANKLTQDLKLISERLDLKTDQEFAVSGEFHFPIDPSFRNGTIISSTAGDIMGGMYNLGEIRGRTANFLAYSDLTVDAIGNNFIINAKLHDLDGNLIVEIEKNNWRLNKNAVSKFNFDSSGFEIFDNTGRIAISIDFRKIGKPKDPDKVMIELQGMIISEDDSVAYLFVKGRTHTDFKLGSVELGKKVYKEYDMHPISPLFKYSGQTWRHIRSRTSTRHFKRV